LEELENYGKIYRQFIVNVLEVIKIFGHFLTKLSPGKTALKLSKRCQEKQSAQLPVPVFAFPLLLLHRSQHEPGSSRFCGVEMDCRFLF